MAISPGKSKPLSDLKFDEACDLLGGADWNDLLKVGEKKRHPVEGFFSSPTQFLFSDPQERRFPLEVLWLKWNLFAELCQEVYRFHKKNRQPHLHIQPEHLHLMIPSQTGASAPVRWLFSLSLEDKAASAHYAEPSMPPDLAHRIFCPPVKNESGYEAPVMFGKAIGCEVTGTALVRSIDPIREEGTETLRGIIELHFLSDEIQPTEFSANDVFLVNLHFHDDSVSPMSIWASTKAPLEKGILLKGLSEAVMPDRWEIFLKAQRSIFSQSKMKIFKAYHAPCDLVSLGMILFRMLLVNDRQDFPVVQRSATHLAGGLAPMVEGVRPEDHRILLKRFKERLHEYGPVFSKQAILYTPGDLTSSIPDDLWCDLLIFAFRLTTMIPHFSFAQNHGDVQMDKPERLMALVLQAVELQKTRIKMALFGSEQRDREMLAVCREIIEEMSDREIAKNAL